MFEQLLMQTNGEAFVNSAWALFIALAAIFATVSAIALKIVLNVRKRLADNKDANSQKVVSIIDDYIIPILETGNKFVNKTVEQEEKIKESSQILYDFMGPKADEITAKPKVQIEKLTADVNHANIEAEKYRVKLERLQQLIDELKSNPEVPVTPATVVDKDSIRS